VGQSSAKFGDIASLCVGIFLIDLNYCDAVSKLCGSGVQHEMVFGKV
jgi:hypothetical protein